MRLCRISNLLIEVLGNRWEFVGNCSWKVWVIRERMWNVVESMKKVWRLGNNVLNRWVKMWLSLIRRMIDKVR